MIDFIPPALILLAGALLIGPTRGALRTAVVLLTPLLTLAAVWQVPDGVVVTLDFLRSNRSKAARYGACSRPSSP